MSVSHSFHDGRGTVLYDDCDRCTELAQFAGLAELDDHMLVLIGEIAAELKAGMAPPIGGYSHNERVATERLRLMARIVFTSEITDEVAR